MTTDDSHRSRRIVVGADGSDSSIDALRWAAHQAALTGAGLEVVSAWHVPPLAYGAGPLPTGFDFEADARAVLEDAVRKALGPEPHVPVTTRLWQDAPARALLRSAKGADLLVIGSRGHGRAIGAILGSVAEACVGRSPCPVVVVRHGCAGELDTL